MKLKTSEIVPLMKVAILSVKYKGKAAATVLEVNEATFADGKKPKLLVEIEGAKYDFVLNVSNQNFVGNVLEEYGFERDSDLIPIMSKMILEVYDTGSSGQYEFGIRVIQLELAKK